MSRHEELIEKRSELLTSLAMRKDATDRLLAGVNTVITGGEEGIRTVAEQNPEIILAALIGLVEFTKRSEHDVREYAEAWFTAQDQLFELGESFDSIANALKDLED